MILRKDEMPEAVEKWLQSLSENSEEGPSRHDRYPSYDPDELMQRAARCYAIAGWADDACRMFVQLGDDRRAAAYFDQAGRWEQAGESYRNVSDWRNAARCFMKCGRPDEAADCFAMAEERIEAAWIWAHEVHRFRKAETEARDTDAETEADRFGIQLILARCEAGTGRTPQGARRLRKLIETFTQLPPDTHRIRLHEWSVQIAEHLNRPDFIAQLHAAAVSSHLPHAHENWEKWAEKVLGDTAGVPRNEDELKN